MIREISPQYTCRALEWYATKFQVIFRVKLEIILNFWDFEIIEITILRILMLIIANFSMHVPRFQSKKIEMKCHLIDVPPHTKCVGNEKVHINVVLWWLLPYLFVLIMTIVTTASDAISPNRQRLLSFLLFAFFSLFCMPANALDSLRANEQPVKHT